MKWISIKDGLPELYEDVIVYTTMERICQASMTSNGYWTGYDWSGEIDVTATHWMPLPEPPKKNK